MNWMERIREIPATISDIKIISHDWNIMKINLSILEIFWSWLMIVRVNIDHKENIAIIEKWNTVDVSMVKNVFS